MGVIFLWLLSLGVFAFIGRQMRGAVNSCEKSTKNKSTTSEDISKKEDPKKILRIEYYNCNCGNNSRNNHQGDVKLVLEFYQSNEGYIYNVEQYPSNNQCDSHATSQEDLREEIERAERGGDLPAIQISDRETEDQG